MTTQQDPHQPSRLVSALLLAGFAVVLVCSVLAFVPANYAILRPGPVTNILGKGDDGKSIVTVSGHEAYADPGKLFFTTVRQTGTPDEKASLLDVAIAAIQPDDDVYDLDQLYPPNTTSEQIKEESAAEMADSQQTATAVALRSIDATVTEHLIIASLVKGSPADGILKAGDRLVSIDGTAVSTGDEVRTAVRKHRPGEQVHVRVRRGTEDLDLTTKTRDADGNAALGVLLGKSYDFPFTVDIDVGQVGGPSAGLMLALGINDLLTPGALAGDQPVAGTGTLADDGAVGPIGGIAQKLVGAREAGARWFLAPADNCAEVRGRVPEGLRVVKVTTFAEALADVRKIGAGDASDLPAC